MDTNTLTGNGKIDKVEYVAAKVKTTFSKSGKPIAHKGAYIYRFRADGAWLIVTEAINAGYLPADAEVISGAMSLIKAKASFATAFAFAGLECPEGIVKASEEAILKIAEADEKRTIKRRETWEAGESSFLAKCDERAAVKWTKLEQEFSED